MRVLKFRSFCIYIYYLFPSAVHFENVQKKVLSICQITFQNSIHKITVFDGFHFQLSEKFKQIKF